MNPTVKEYMRLLAERGEQEDHLGRFYVALHDEELQTLEGQLERDDDGLSLSTPVLVLYSRWKAEMGSEQWAEVWAYNERLGDADRNWLVSEAMDEEFALVTV